MAHARRARQQNINVVKIVSININTSERMENCKREQGEIEKKSGTPGSVIYGPVAPFYG